MRTLDAKDKKKRKIRRDLSNISADYLVIVTAGEEEYYDHGIKKELKLKYPAGTKFYKLPTTGKASLLFPELG